jgi:hypothetical protein
MKTTALLAVFLLATPALAQEMPVPKMFQGMDGQKGRWQMEILETSGRGKGMGMTICTSNPVDEAAKARSRRGADCQHRLLKDTVDEAVVQSECKERKSTVHLKRDGSSMLANIESTGSPRGPQSMKMRFTHLGPCRESPG